MASKAYTVNKENKTITKDDSKLTQKDRDTIAMYIAGGYTLRDKSEKRTETMTKRAAENHFTKEEMVKYLSKDEEALKTFNAILKGKGKGHGIFAAKKYFMDYRNAEK